MLEAKTLYVVSTPIGNLNDICPRAIETLKSVSLILCEDTRTFKRLASHFSIETKLLSYHDHNEVERSKQIIELLEQGESIALVSDAGTPTISDPGYRIINACHENNYQVSPVPGPSAIIAALSCSGFETHKFVFGGFLPIKEGKRKSTLEEALNYESTSIFYESPYRIVKSLKTLSSLEPKREIVVARELTKKFEEITRGEASVLMEDYSKRPKIKGEFVLLIRGQSYSAPS